MILKAADELEPLTKAILCAGGADERNADVVAEHLVLANLSGVDTHGVWHVSGYVDAIRDGHLVPTAWPKVVEQTPTSALISGNWTFGQTAARKAMEVAIEKAKSQNIAIVSLVQSHHIGRLGHYAELAAAEGMISMVWGGGYCRESPRTVPFGGRKAILDTNPIAMGFPAGDDSPMILDFATTTLSGVKVINAQRRGQNLPPGCIVDKDGNPSIDPNDFTNGGAFVAFGAHKGYALMMAAEFFGRIFSGSDGYAESERGGPIFGRQGVTMAVCRADLFQPSPQYSQNAVAMERSIRSVPPAPGFDQVLVPGDKEAQTRIKRRREGIPIDDDVWQSVVEVAERLGVQWAG